VSEMFATPIIRVMISLIIDANVDKLQPHYTEQQPRRQPPLPLPVLLWWVATESTELRPLTARSPPRR
jgi:hypothetical protein